MSETVRSILNTIMVLGGIFVVTCAVMILIDIALDSVKDRWSRHE